MGDDQVSRRTTTAVTIGAVLVLGLGAVATVAAPAQVEKSVAANGAPAAPKFDPASQPQTSLLEAASRYNPPNPDDIILGKGTPRAAVRAPSSVAAAGQPGCIPQYGKDGQCLPLVPPSQTAHVGHIGQQQLTRLWTCAEVRTLFPDGVALASNADPLRLDTNNDRIACGQGDS